jgi:hypothetical protein
MVTVIDMNIPKNIKSIVCRICVTVAVTSVLLMVLWQLMLAISSITIPDLPWETICVYVMTLFTACLTCVFIWWLWKCEEGLSVFFGVVLSATLFLCARFSAQELGIISDSIMFLSIVVSVEIAMLVVHEHIAKKVCKRLLGGNNV